MNPLPLESLLTALGEVAAAFVGFSLVVGILQERPSVSTTEARRAVYSMRDVAEIGLTVVGASFLPIVIHGFGVNPDTTWRFASASLFVIAMIEVGFSMRRHRFFFPREFATVTIGALNFVSFAFLLSNVLAVGPTSGARYSASVLLALAVAGIAFVNTTFKKSNDEPPDGEN